MFLAADRGCVENPPSIHQSSQVHNTILGCPQIYLFLEFCRQQFIMAEKILEIKAISLCWCCLLACLFAALNFPKCWQIPNLYVPIKGSSRYSIKVWEWQQIMPFSWPHFIWHNLPAMIDHRLVIVCVCWTWMFLEAIESAATLDLIAMEWPHSCPLCWVHSLAHQKRAHPTPYPLCWVSPSSQEWACLAPYNPT